MFFRACCASLVAVTLASLAVGCSDLTRPSDDRVTTYEEPAPPPPPQPAATQPPTPTPPKPTVTAPPPEPPIKAAHILIAYKGSERADPKKVTRTKEQAKKLAEDLAKKAQNPKEDFAALAKKNSDDPGSGPKGGDLGAFTRNQMVKPFSDAAFALKPNEVTKTVVETQFGFHVIKRLP